MSADTGPFKRFWRRAYATLIAMSVVAIAAGCATTRWVPVTQARPTGDKVRLRVEVPRDSEPSGTRLMTLYYPRMEDDSVLVGTPVPGDTAMVLGERIPAASASVLTESLQTKQVRHYNTLEKIVIGVGVVLGVGGLVVVAGMYSER